MGAHPQNSAAYDQPKPEEPDHGNTVKDITRAARPKAEPVYGSKGPLTVLWKWIVTGQSLAFESILRCRRVPSYLHLYAAAAKHDGMRQESLAWRIACLWPVLAVYSPRLRLELPPGPGRHPPSPVSGPASGAEGSREAEGGRRAHAPEGHTVHGRGFFLVRTQRIPLGVGAAPAARTVARPDRARPLFADDGPGVCRQQGQRR